MGFLSLAVNCMARANCDFFVYDPPHHHLKGVENDWSKLNHENATDNLTVVLS
jgi:hypothetical protein